MPPQRPRSSRRRTSPSSPLVLLQFECSRVDAVTQPRRPRAVGENVAEVSTAIRAHHLGPDHPEGRVGLFVDRLRACRGGEGRPSAAGVVLRFRAEELGATARAAIGAGLEGVVVLAGERSLGPLLPEYVIPL